MRGVYLFSAARLGLCPRSRWPGKHYNLIFGVGLSKVNDNCEDMMRRANVLVVEDEPDIQELIKYQLTKEGYEVTQLASGDACVDTAKSKKPDLVLLDLMLPGIDGFDVCRLLKANEVTSKIPVIMLTAKGEDADIVTGLELGAEDYITKPFSPKVLVARVRAVLRRCQNAIAPTKNKKVEVSNILIDPERFEVKVNGALVELTHTEFKILYLLVCNAGKVYTREQIVTRVHGDDYPVTMRSIDVQVVSLRKKLGDLGNLIETIRGVGYRFKEDE
ncbi:MAG: response regulator transcription factor [Bdellovibrionales bacterium]|nr:response regulator transcription factor [Bdellovibrionales bacterium]